MENIEDAWLLIVESTLSMEKLSSFIDYFVNEWMNNPNLPLKMWNMSMDNNIVQTLL